MVAASIEIARRAYKKFEKRMDLSKDRKRSTHIVGLKKPMEGRTRVSLYVLERSIRYN